MESTRWIIEYAALGLELAGTAVIVAGAIHATLLAGLHAFSRSGEGIFQQYRVRLGRGILLGLEFLVAGDIINTVAVESTFYSVGVLAAIVLVRTFLSVTLEVEMTGRWPWE